MESFSHNLRHYRYKAGYETAKQFADDLGVSYTTYFAYESKGREPKYDLLIKIADMLDVSIDELIRPKQAFPRHVFDSYILNLLSKDDECGIQR